MEGVIWGQNSSAICQLLRSPASASDHENTCLEAIEVHLLAIKTLTSDSHEVFMQPGRMILHARLKPKKAWIDVPLSICLALTQCALL